MIKVSGNVFDCSTLKNSYASDSIEWKICDIICSSSVNYKYDSIEQFKFEILLRTSIIKSAKALNRSHMTFKTFRRSRCNDSYWNRMDNGGFKLKDGVKPSDGINDIFNNGWKYGTECATAMIIVYYKAILSVYQDAVFNELFSNIELMNWHSIDPNLALYEYESVADSIPGDCRYFKNPDVNPVTPEWQGENVIDLGDGTYYGHGIGIRSANQIIKSLNSERKHGSTQPAYLLDSAKRQNFKYLSKKTTH